MEITDSERDVLAFILRGYLADYESSPPGDFDAEGMHRFAVAQSVLDKLERGESLGEFFEAA